MKYNFDEIINRKNTNSLKYDFAVERGKPANVLPLWVADMDVMAAPEIIAAIIAGCQHGIFGYSDVKRDYFLTIAKWLDESFNWKVQENWMVKAPGVVFSMAMAVMGIINAANGESKPLPLFGRHTLIKPTT